eukprot:gene11766-24666_t
MKSVVSHRSIRRRNVKIKNVDECKWAPETPATIKIDDSFKVNYSQEENFKAYQAFTMIDTDHSGRISLDELRYVLNGDRLKTIVVPFPHPDVGIIWGLDEDSCVIIQEIEVGSPAILNENIFLGLRLIRINNVDIPKYSEESLDIVDETINEIFDKPVEFTFVEPLLVVSSFTADLDIIVHGSYNDMYTATLPVGAVFRVDILDSLQEADPVLAAIDIQIDKVNRQFTFSCESYPFQLLFGTGPNFQTCCRFVLDTPLGTCHTGQALSTDMHLGIRSTHTTTAGEEVEILMREVFIRFNVSKSGEFEFEEFRSFFI